MAGDVLLIIIISLALIVRRRLGTTAAPTSTSACSGGCIRCHRRRAIAWHARCFRNQPAMELRSLISFATNCFLGIEVFLGGGGAGWLWLASLPEDDGIAAFVVLDFAATVEGIFGANLGVGAAVAAFADKADFFAREDSGGSWDGSARCGMRRLAALLIVALCF